MNLEGLSNEALEIVVNDLMFIRTMLRGHRESVQFWESRERETLERIKEAG